MNKAECFAKVYAGGGMTCGNCKYYEELPMHNQKWAIAIGAAIHIGGYSRKVGVIRATSDHYGHLGTCNAKLPMWAENESHTIFHYLGNVGIVVDSSDASRCDMLDKRGL